MLKALLGTKVYWVVMLFCIIVIVLGNLGVYKRKDKVGDIVTNITCVLAVALMFWIALS